VQGCLDVARAEGLQAVYLLTTTAAAFFQRWGFAPHARAAVPGVVRASVELSQACPESATCLAWTAC
jgi:amino-acid N-acetyltransferase